MNHRGHFLSAPGKPMLSSPSPSVGVSPPRLRAQAAPPARSGSLAAELQGSTAGVQARGCGSPAATSETPLAGSRCLTVRPADLRVSETGARP